MGTRRAGQLAGLAALACALSIAEAGAAQVPLLDVASVLPSRQSERAGPDAPGPAEHRLNLAAGQRVIVSAQSSEFDTLVQVLRPGEARPLAENDDFGGSLNSRLVFTADRPGEYLVKVSSFSAEDGGSYQLRVEPAPPLPRAETRPSATLATAWRLFDGRLDAGDAQGAAGRFDDVRVGLQAGRQVIILLDAAGGGFDPMVEVYLERGRNGAPIDSNDDGGSGFGSVLLFTPPETGDYIIRVASFGGDGRGDYRLRIGETPLRR